MPARQLGRGTGPGRPCGEQLGSSWDGAVGTRPSPRPRPHRRPQTGAEPWAPHFSTLRPTRRQHLLPSLGAQRGQVLSPPDPAGKLPNHPARPGCQDPWQPPQSQSLPAGESPQGLRGQSAEAQVQEPTPCSVTNLSGVLTVPGGANTVTKSPLPGRKQMCGDVL